MKETHTTVEAQLRTRCQTAPISYRDFIEIALYSTHGGYYQQAKERVGRSAKRDFYTAESLGRVFATLVTTAAADLLSPQQAAATNFVEIAAEPGTSLLSHLENHPFATEQVIRQGEAIQPSGQVVIFANEWLDALPFHRLIFRDGSWRERGVGLNCDGQLVEVLLDQWTPAVAAVAESLPAQIEDGYELDLPLDAEAALAELLAQDWQGLLLLFDYGRTWTSLLQDHPSGTARTYRQHSQGNNLLEAPGHCDITCDINWTPLQAQMQSAGLQSVVLESQESFLVKRAQRAAESIVSNSAGHFSHDRQTLMELIHPANMGQRFQVLWGLRRN
ncbi:SAM-dependent methyltransferase [Coraliomargarita sp. SDUM461004]|uniref:SAM-dependent methyltransferase n=1 Tax=Thalassobacterium sedimentorum TaxID=3041258 RepID=A0ABU1APU0_9BACT|nr:SAM-dependent methyltransferase [Coraliomargarita sp. SDUM461004]MDQ8195608.1 SAM-dependent methyltransferase [Coraliomargarita sp. SDUM461004]